MDVPHLIDDNVRIFLQYSLKKCHDNRVTIYSYTLNFVVFFLFVTFVFVTLYYCRRRKKNPYERMKEMEKEQDFILSKIRYCQQLQKAPLETLTHLPLPTHYYGGSIDGDNGISSYDR